MNHNKDMIFCIFFYFILSICCDDSVSVNNKVVETLSSLVVEPEWLNQNLGNKNVIIIDSRGFPPKNGLLYKGGHIPGAINANYAQFTSPATEPKTPGWFNILPAAELGPKLAALGVDETKIIVVYGDNSSNDSTRFGQDGRLVWIMRMAGLKNTRMLNGGLPRWVSLGYALATDSLIPTLSNLTIPSLDTTLTVTTAYLSSNISPSLKIIDSRTLAEYQGAQLFGEARGGHLPGAIHFHYADVLDPLTNVYKPVSQLHNLFSGMGLLKTDEIIVYCTSGIRSGHLTMVLQTLGYNRTRNYDDSFHVWASDSTLPLE